MKAPNVKPDTPLESLNRQLKQGWWLWGSVLFAFLLIGGLVLYRHRLYNTGGYGLPFLAGEAVLLGHFHGAPSACWQPQGCLQSVQA